MVLEIAATDFQSGFKRQTRLAHFHFGFFFRKLIRIIGVVYYYTVGKLDNTVSVLFRKLSVVGNEYNKLFL